MPTRKATNQSAETSEQLCSMCINNKKTQPPGWVSLLLSFTLLVFLWTRGLVFLWTPKIAPSPSCASYP